MTDRSLQELANAEIAEGHGGENSMLVRFGENDYELINKSPKHRLVVKRDVLDRDEFTYGDVTVDVDLQRDEYTLSCDGREIRVPPEKHEHVLWALYDEDGPRLNKLFDALYVPTVREGLMDNYMPRYRANDEIRKTDDGWIVEDDVLVSWDADNHPIDVTQTYVIKHGEAVEADHSRTAREIEFPEILGPVNAVAPHGQTYELREVEAQFLATVALLDGGAKSVYDDGLYHYVESCEIEAFTDSKSGLHHNHDVDKHSLEDLNVTQDAIDRLWYNEYDHTGVHELALRQDEFEDAPIDVFEDAPNDSTQKWNMIERTREKAPIPGEVRDDLEARYA